MNSIFNQLNDLKKEKNAIILAHIYQRPEIHDIADFIGDSLDLSKKVVATDAETIVFCGVHFMAETAHILNPNKKVLIPDINAGCPMADMITVQELKNFKSKFKNPFVIAYINTSAEIKAHSDICCTSSNAVNILRHVASSNKHLDILFIPDRNLGNYVQKVSGIKINVWNGFCPTHNNFILPEYVLKAKKEHPLAEVLVHPECRPEVIEIANYAMSTGTMCKYIKNSNNKDFIIGTEIGILYRLKKENPNKNFYPVTNLSECPNMKKTTIEKVFDVLKNTKNIVSVNDKIRKKAYLSIYKMLNVPC
ncbi:MAG: quinolinate synthase NadA [Endomicrobium sp.]|jgi:quinolinate synthase|uniref:quinolinate synthase NadA n=1 Tax=Candidatus Endomicrobiellum cubanum TaxID=3242325 RepID=UPI002818B32D|nr:quinolinate synthase NadA [Endomicrobium sp.]